MRRTLLTLTCLALSATCRAADPPDTFANLPRKLTVDVLQDQKQIWTSPFRMNGNSAKWWIAMGAATAALVATDSHTITTFENGPTQVRVGNDVSKIAAVYTVIPVVAGFYTIGALTKNPKARETGFLGGEALIDGLIVQAVLKPIAGRNRPNAAHGKQEWFEGGASFPSGHTIAAFALASVVAREYSHRKWVPIVAYGLATAVGAARFTGQQHYASDILAGGAIGFFIGRYVFKTRHTD